MEHLTVGYGRIMSESVFERDDYEHTDDGIGSPEDELPESPSDPMLEQGYSPPERPRGLDAFGTTLSEERAGESLDQRLAQEEPDPAMEVDRDEGSADPGSAADDALAERAAQARARRDGVEPAARSSAWDRPEPAGS